jgi:hypothetical protein
MTTYPAQLEFRLTEPILAAVIQAALDLHLPFETDGPKITVVVESAMKALRVRLPIAGAARAHRAEGALMALGPGKYDDLASDVRTKAQARGVLLLVVDGTRGSGFSAQLSLPLTLRLPQILRDIADQIEERGPDA